MALWGIIDRAGAKRLYRHASVSESLFGQNQILDPSPAIKLIVTASTTAPSR
jgi:hypothetical protein